MKYQVKVTSKALKQLKKLDKVHSEQILRWINKNLKDIENPYLIGKQLKGNLGQYWRYRVGNYRIISKIDNQQLIVLLVAVAHRREVYE